MWVALRMARLLHRHQNSGRWLCGLEAEISAGERACVACLRSSELQQYADLLEETPTSLPTIVHASHPLAPADEQPTRNPVKPLAASQVQLEIWIGSQSNTTTHPRPRDSPRCPSFVFYRRGCEACSTLHSPHTNTSHDLQDSTFDPQVWRQ